MRFSILGETLARHDDGTVVPLGGPARRALLALLLASPGEVVSADRLAEEIAPGGAVSAHALQAQVSRLRATLGPAAIERAGAGYRAAVEPDDVDACRFERLAGEGRTALGEGDAARAVALLHEALGLWRGEPLADAAGSPSAQAAAARLQEGRLGAIEDRIEGELRLGRSRAALPGLRELVGRHPLRERLAGLLMRALCAEGGQAEALVVFEGTRRHLAEELGADPSAELAALHREMLSVDPTPSPVAPPAPLTSFVGRAGEVDEIAGLLRVARLVTLTGPGGVGKTRLSVEVAAVVAAAAEVCFVELAPVRDGADLPGVVLGALGLRESGLQPGGGGQTPTARLVTALSDRVLLLVLDNCEQVVDEAAALAARLLAACPRLRVLATSREPLAVIGESLRQVRPLDEAAAARLFSDRAEAVRRGAAADPDGVRRVCAALDHLPLAIELVAARLRTMDLRDLAGRLDDRLGMATARSHRTADERHRTLRSVVAWSWELLSASERRAAERFTVFAAGATVAAARQVCGCDGETLESLIDKSLLEFTGGRLRMLETVRAYGAERLEAAGEADAVRDAHARLVIALARTADPHLRRDEQLEWLDGLAAEHGNLLAAARWAARSAAWETLLELLASAATWLWIRGLPASVAPQAAALLDALGELPSAGLGEEYAACVLLAAAGPDGPGVWRRHRARAERALAAAWPGDRAGRHPALLLPWMMRSATDDDPRRAFVLVSSQADCPDPWVRALARYVSGFAALGEGDAAGAGRAFRAAVDGFRSVGDRWGRALALDALAALAGASGDRAAAVALTDEALALTEQLGALEDSADLLVNRGDHVAGDDVRAAGAAYARAAALARRAGSSTYLAAALRGLGDMARLAGDPAEAERLYTEALERTDPHWVRSAGNRVRTLAGLGRVAEARGDRATAEARYREAADAASAVLGDADRGSLRMLGLPAAVVDAVSAR
ncbi:BTAD domain-containing putative transcriptional regulator [Streptomyces sp. SP18ES09]|uniref:BTAD domain-containing putative transcriptional regulator n=1 Tax=Streptomyces sp. SP18ES09 TaxID=3002532 RepID=UPI002E76D84D|nr:BTAD domain-containing putative transcriptional regulator [Streptomyces sp. SP18ES09]MEE1816182.1 BTAD domain-containing putative transcriptional regulator [Streptomyces sp. SP18ES09]